MILKKLIHKKSKAQAMVEFAIALPVLLLLLYGILETGRYLFLYSTVVTASRQAVRYGSATGQGVDANGNPISAFRYQDCAGIRRAAQNYAFLGAFDTISIANDTGPGTLENPYCAPPAATANFTPSGNNSRISVTVSKMFTPLVRLIPWNPRPISATSSRTILNSVAIVVDIPPEVVVQNPTITEIDFFNPEPSEPNQSVTVQVSVYDDVDPSNTPTGTVDVSAGAGISCQIILNTDGWGTCTLVFTSSGNHSVTATYGGDDEHLASDDTETHVVGSAPTVTTITSDLPDPSTRNQDVVVFVTVTGGSTTPTGIVDVDAGGNNNCTITLVNGTGSCTLNFNNLGSRTITANYNGDSTHLTSSDTEVHEVLDGTATPSQTPTITPPPTITPIPSITPIPTITPVPSPTPTRVPSCNAVTHGPITKSGNTMTMTITNPYTFPITTGAGTVTWNDDRGHQTGSDKSLRLQTITIGSTIVWTGNSTDVSTMPFNIPAIIPPNSTVTVTFTFHQSYDNFDGTEDIYLNLSTPGCENDPIQS